MYRRLVLGGAAVGVAAAVVVAPALAGAERLLIHGGPIYTGVADRPKAEAVVVDGDRIVFVGRLAEAGAMAKGARDIDLKGAAAYPGFIDAHAHLMGVGFREMTLNLDQVTSVEGLKAALKAYADANPGSATLYGRGWIETHWPEKRFPSRQDLDSVIKDRPVLLERADGHASVANSAALVLGAVTRNTAPPAGGDILKDAAGEPTGMLIDAAQALVGAKFPEPSTAEKMAAVEMGAQVYAARGWTGIGNMSVSADELAAQQALAAEGRLPIRVDDYMDLDASPRLMTEGPFSDPSGLVRVRGIKVYRDGALGSRGAALLEPYSDAATTGLLQMDYAQAQAAYRRALAVNAQVATHAIGDKGNRLTLDGYDEVFRGAPKAERRWRIEHAQVISAADMGRFARMNVIASMQPSHAIGDLYFAPARLGPTRLEGAYAWKTLLRSGAVVAAGSDAPVEVGSPLIEFYAAVTRKDLKGKSGADWRPEEAVSRASALRMLTWAGAYAAFDEENRGTLELGKKADITVFSKDLMTVPEADILTARTVLTMVDGRIVHWADTHGQASGKHP